MSRDKIADNIVKALDGSAYFHKEQVLDSGDARPEREPYLTPSKISEDHLQEIAAEAAKILDKDLMAFNEEAAVESALELTIRDFSGGQYDGKVDAESFLKLKGLVMDRKKIGGFTMKRTASYYTSKIDKIANEIRNMVVAGELSPEQGYELEYALDEVSDELEKHASALEHDADEEFMKEFGNDPAAKEHDADEKYMKDFHNGGQNVVSESLKKASLDASKLAAKRK